MTRNILTVLFVLAVVASPALADLVTTQTWDFTTYTAFDTGSAKYTFDPSSYTNPNGKPYMEVWVDKDGGTHNDDGTLSKVKSLTAYIDNYPNNNPTKEIDLYIRYKPSQAVNFDNITIGGADTFSRGDWTKVTDGDWVLGTFHFVLHPNPNAETLSVAFTSVSTDMLDYVTIDTRCIPVPGAILIGTIGLGLVAWARKRMA